jgi:transcriptional regulator of acetoin/glycerol metabolism
MGEPESDTASERPSSKGQRLSQLLPHLFVVASCDQPLAGGSRHALHRIDVVTLGRGESRSVRRRTESGLEYLVLALPGRQVSATHARLSRAGARWIIEDCESTNGVYVNGERTARADLADGDVIEVGRTVLLFRAMVPTPAGTAADVDTHEVIAAGCGLATLMPALAREVASFANVARSALPLLLVGEAGTGKEVLARAAHALSGRVGSLVAVNCGAIAESLQQGQLFGHMRGSFSGAIRDEVGLVRAADKGTLFLDEIGDLPPSSQAALLRVLQEGEVHPIGATRPIRLDLRVLAATNRPLDRLIETGQFRSDLHSRLNGYTYPLTPLRARMGDLPLLLGALLPRIAPREGTDTTFTPAAVRAILRHRWPLNVRELQQALARAVVLAQGERIDESHLPPEVVSGTKPTPPRSPGDEESSEEALRHQLRSLLDLHEGNVSEVARSMGKARMQIHRWMKRFELEAKRGN